MIMIDRLCDLIQLVCLENGFYVSQYIQLIKTVLRILEDSNFSQPPKEQISIRSVGRLFAIAIGPARN